MSRKYFVINLNNKKTQNESVLDLTVGVSLLFIYRETHLLNVIVIGLLNRTVMVKAGKLGYSNDADYKITSGRMGE